MKKLLEKRLFRILLACISLLFLVDMIQDTYAKYISSASASGDFTIARWSFLVNNQDVLANSDFSNTIIPTIDSNANISSGVIAPTSTGHFEIAINSANVDVAFDQQIVLSQSNDNTVSDIVFVGYKINNGSVVSLNDVTTATINSTHLLTDSNTNTYTFYIKWNDNASTETMDNADDTEASDDGVASVNVSLNFIQKASSQS